MSKHNRIHAGILATVFQVALATACDAPPQGMDPDLEDAGVATATEVENVIQRLETAESCAAGSYDNPAKGHVHLVDAWGNCWRWNCWIQRGDGAPIHAWPDFKQVAIPTFPGFNWNDRITTIYRSWATHLRIYEHSRYRGESWTFPVYTGCPTCVEQIAPPPNMLSSGWCQGVNTN
jgi:hypothetical protein